MLMGVLDPDDKLDHLVNSEKNIFVLQNELAFDPGTVLPPKGDCSPCEIESSLLVSSSG